MSMKEFTVVTGNGSTYTYVAEHIEQRDGFFHLIVDGKTVGIKAIYGVVSISDKPYNQRFV
jgi:hypothetical protein